MNGSYSPFMVEDTVEVVDDMEEFEPEALVTGAYQDIPTILQGAAAEESRVLPAFEGKEVKAALLSVPLKLDEFPNATIDDRVCITAHVRIRNVEHKVGKEGEIVRVIKAVQEDAFVTPFEEGKDDGVIRS